MKVVIPREAIGVAIGVAVFSFAVLFFGYGIMSWITWETNPGRWSDAERSIMLGISFVLLGLRWAMNSVVFSEE